jgi:hypothetical protein
MSQDHSDTLLLKWGTIKGWNIKDEKSLAILQQYFDLGTSMSCMTQPRTARHKAVLCDLINQFNGTITNDWDGEEYTKEQAVRYILDYDKKR